MKREKCVVIFKRSAQGNGARILDIVVLQAYLLETVHHLHALSESFATLTADIIRVTVELAQTIVVAELFSDFARTNSTDVVVVDVQNTQVLLVLEALGEG